MKKISISHICLYAKGWYQWSDNIIADVYKLYCIDYGNTIDKEVNKQRLARVLVNELSKLPTPLVKLTHFLFEIEESKCASFGYYTKKYFGEQYPEYDYYEAIIRYCLSILRFVEVEYIDIKKPDAMILPIPHDKRGHIEEFFGHLDKPKPKTLGGEDYRDNLETKTRELTVKYINAKYENI
jgi:hypothetical protein